MAPKSTTLTTLLLLLAFTIVNASIYRTTITTVETMDPNDSQSERCRGEVQQRRIDACRSYMRYGRGTVLMGGPTGESAPQQCCQQLRNVREDCRCEAIRQMVNQEMQEGQGQQEQQEQQQEMVRRAENLPRMCGMGPQHCRISQGGY